MSDQLRVGIIGCGNICGIYFKNLCQDIPGVKVTAAADLILERAQEKADEYGIRAMPVGELLASSDVDIVLNLTIPAAHFEVSMQAIEAGKHVYAEKPITQTRDEARRVLAAAEAKGLRVGNAPDTFMGAGIQTCRKLIQSGWVGEPIGGQAFMLCHGHESWHPSPEFYYQHGGGPMFDMGPYYLTTLVHLLGPVCRVSGSTSISFPTRTITSQPKFGKVVDVEIPTHVIGMLEFANSAHVTITTSFDVWGSRSRNLEIFGSEATLSIPDPNTFGGAVELKTRHDSEWRQIPYAAGYAENSRGLGLIDMAKAIQEKREHLASGKLAVHVLDIMHAIHESADQGKRIELSTTC